MSAEQLEKKYLEKTSVSAGLAQQARQYMPGGDTHGHFYNPPYYTTIERGNGCYLYDVDGNRYIDCVNGYYVLAHGHCFPPTVAAIAEQINSGTTFGIPTRAQIDLARHLCERVPSLDELRFATSGSEATTMCIRAARAFTGKRKIMRVDGGYHGNHNIGELNSFVIGERDEQSHMPPVGTASSDLDDVILFPWNHPDALEQIISRHADETAAVIMEPMMLYGGWLLPDTGYLERVRRLTEENNILLVFDEVVTLLFSYGGLQEYFGVTPDLTAMGKAIGGGLPIGAWGGRRDIVELWNPERGEDAVMSIATFGGNPLSMVAGLTALQHLTEAAIERRNKLSDRLREEVDQAIADARIRAHMSGLFNTFGIQWTDKTVRDPYEAAEAMSRVTDRVRSLFFMGMRYRGVYFFPAPTPFGNISTAVGDKEIDHIVNAVGETLSELYPVIEAECPAVLQ